MSLKKMNFEVYKSSSQQWIQDKNHPIALLRAECAFRLPWVLEQLSQIDRPHILDAGCGAGFLSNALSLKGYRVTGMDQSKESLEIARAQNTTSHYVAGQLEKMPFDNHSFDVICAMDVLEHLKDYTLFLKEVKRVLKPNGKFIFFTFNQTWQSKLLAKYSLEWLFPKTGKNIHLYELFIHPKDLEIQLKLLQFNLEILRGVRPVIFQKPMWTLLRHQQVEDGFAFTFTPSLKVAYMGLASSSSASI